MFTFSRKVKGRIVLSAVGVGAMAMATFAASTPASAVNELVTGKFDTQFVIGGDCQAAAGICADGTTSGNLKGTFNIGVTKFLPPADTGANGVIHFVGDATVESKDGTLRCQTSAILQTVGEGVLVGLCVVTPGTGTGKWANASGYFQVNGTASFLTGAATGEYRGFIEQE